ncbi:GNAT family N-acetyltransferase [Sphingomonas sp. MAH-20]|uniref:GNAT family N-acetyltransferase n=1 Tax=Sphingomonas horti TaxID=2682842 RepID=A0A6I4J0D4_9SPHN|nr:MULTISPECIES: GNAT family protein [Sphingomonas]MBA2919758.1 GNAT family N-acetyltransferase [Sphingomonas sp. CGMCC 1.13658]MVO77999.1 GNAT family N-acetyltransferase [Sphingomonas horti]
MNTLRGQKVILQRFTLDDVTDTYIGWLNDPDVVRYSNQRFRRHDYDTCLSYLRSFDDGPNLFVSVRTFGGEPIGTMTVYRSLPHGTADVGILIGKKCFWGGGFGQDAWNLMLGWLLGQPAIRKVTAGTLACNRGMVRVMERSGMELEGVRRRQELVDGEPVDLMLYGKFAR